MKLEQLFHRLINNNDTVINLGAFEGELTQLFSALVGSHGCVYAFEPHPSHFLELSKKAYTSPLRNIYPYCKAVTDFSGHCPIFLAPPATAKSSSILPWLGSEKRLGAGVEICLAETLTLDDFVRTTACKPDLIKIDIEGAEKLVFSGGRNVFEVFHPLVVFECASGYSEQHKMYCFNEPEPVHIAWLESIGYQIFIIDIDFFKDEWVTPDSPAHCSRYGLLSVSAPDFQRIPVMGCNLLAVHNSHSMVAGINAYVHEAKALDYLSQFSLLTW